MSSKRKIALIVGILAGIIAISAVVWFANLPQNSDNNHVSPQQVAEQYVSAMLERDGQALLDLFPDSITEGLLKEMGYQEESQLVSVIEERYVEPFQNLLQNHGLDLHTCSFVLSDPEAVSNDTLSDIQNAYAILNVPVSSGRVIEVQFFAAQSENSVIEVTEIPLIESDGWWYLDLYSMLMTPV